MNGENRNDNVHVGKINEMQELLKEGGESEDRF